MKKIFIVNKKGGVGKSFYAKLLFLLSQKHKTPLTVFDTDNATPTLLNFCNQIKSKKPDYIKFSNSVVDLLGADKKIDRSKFDDFLSVLDTIKTACIVDFGAASSEQFINYLLESDPIIIDVLKELNVEIHIILAGGDSFNEALQSYNDIIKINEIGKITKIVANEFLGSINSKSVKEVSSASIQITALTPDDYNSSAQIEFNNLIKNGCLYDDILALQILRRTRIIRYLEILEKQVNFITSNNLFTQTKEEIRELALKNNQ